MTSGAASRLPDVVSKHTRLSRAGSAAIGGMVLFAYRLRLRLSSYAVMWGDQAVTLYVARECVHGGGNRLLLDKVAVPAP
jgi:hypothetical protein